MFKNIILAVLIAIVLTYSLGQLSTQWLDLHFSFDGYDIEPILSVLLITAMVVILVVVGFIIACSIFAAIFFAIIAAIFGMFVAGMSVFWPIILFTVVICLLVRDKRAPTY